LPIVAMTANTTEADRRMCLLAGMNAHVGKPFEIDSLVDTLRQLTGRRTRSALPVTDLPELADAAWQAAADAGVDLAAALGRFGGNLPVYRRLLRSALAELPLRLESLRAHLHDGNRPAAAALLHALRGLAGALGADAIAGAAAEGERICRDGSLPADATLSARLEEAAARLASAGPALASALDASGPAGSTAAIGSAASAGTAPVDAQAPGSAARIAARLQRLVTTLRASDMHAFELLEQGRDDLRHMDPALLADL
jgi:CheY-like chemotaxis protein